METVYNQNRFEIKQKLMIKQANLVLSKKVSNNSI